MVLSASHLEGMMAARPVYVSVGSFQVLSVGSFQVLSLVRGVLPGDGGKFK